MHRRTIGCAFLVGLAGIVLLGGFAYPMQRAARRFGPPDPALGFMQRWRLSLRLLLHPQALEQVTLPPEQEVTLVISPGTSAREVAGQLWEQGLLPDPAVFLAYLIYTGADHRLQQGTYRLRGPLSPRQIARQLQNPHARLITVRVLPGWRREQIAASLDTGSPLHGEDFLAATQRASDYHLPFPVPAGASLEGFLFPATYALAPEDQAADLVRAMLARFSQEMTPSLLGGFNAQGLTPYQGLILASIIQREAVPQEEMPLIASVYLNRLHQGMPLEADPTVQYALGRPGQWWKSPLSAADLEVDSPFNTYRHPGLPPAPIANPGAEALRAVAFPAQTSYLFFRAACDGSGRHVFSRTFQEHLQHQCP